MAYALDAVAGVTAAFTDCTLWPDLRDKAPLGRGIVQDPYPSCSQGSRDHEYHCKAHHTGRGYDQMSRE